VGAFTPLTGTADYDYSGHAEGEPDALEELENNVGGRFHYEPYVAALCPAPRSANSGLSFFSLAPLALPRYEVQKVDNDPSGKKEALAYFFRLREERARQGKTDVVPKRWTDFGQSVIFAGVPDPSPFLRINVFQAFNPPRESFRIDEAAPEEEWSKKLIFYAFARPMPNTVRYEISYSTNPYRHRLLPQKAAGQAKRDISRWNQSRVDQETHFYAFPVHVPGTQLLHVDWTSSPDRYKLTNEMVPTWQWTRCFSFFAYTANKFHVLECKVPDSSPIPDPTPAAYSSHAGPAIL
jgi:hypothetical protein